MNKTKIEYGKKRWNPIVGCLNKCPYCYAKMIYKRFPALGNPEFIPKFYPERLKELSKFKEPSRVLVCFTADLFGDWTKPEWRAAVINEMLKFPQHTYLLLTKQPQNIKGVFSNNVWIGATVTCAEEKSKIEEIKKVVCGKRFVSFEPLLGDIGSVNFKGDIKGVDWIIIGKLTGSKRIPLQNEWVTNLIKQALEQRVRIFIKNNVKWIEKIQQFP